MKLGERLFEYRRKKGLSQEEVATKLNVTRQTVSKWETDQSVPDFDKIVPICELFEITTSELLQGKKEENNAIINNTENKKRRALMMSTSIFLYFLSIIWIILASESFNIDEGLMVSVFMLICAIATILIIYNSIANSSQKKKESEKEKKYNKKLRDIIPIVSISFIIIYLLISFITFAWHITWIIWLVYSLVIAILKLIFSEDDKNE